MKKTNKLSYVLMAVLSLILLIVTAICTSGGVQVHASTSTYSDVLEDLRTDEQVNVEKFPLIEDDNNINVIQIAESSDGDLLIYCYQPSGQAGNIKASSINIARELDDSEDLQFKNHRLAFQNSSPSDFSSLPEFCQQYFLSCLYWSTYLNSALCCSKT